MRVLRPGKAGIKKLERRFGDKLICVRYRYDKERNVTLKTVELVVEEFPRKSKEKKIAPDEVMYVQVGYKETELREKIKKVGGWWNKDKKLWELTYKDVIRLQLEDRIIWKQELK